MNEFTLKLNYEHPSCSLILDLYDKNWINVFSVEELDEIKNKCVEKDISFQFPEKDFLNTIPRTTDIIKVFNHISNIVIDPVTERDLYWLKITIQQAADLFATNYLPLTDHSERDVMRRVWSFIDTAFDAN
ncbi:hypothetical protein RMCBS344292_01770 [Rhizopus microsporus]|nr:hypothetical protein RMCBS344292_01770 [Rhizopus microsporus]